MGSPTQKKPWHLNREEVAGVGLASQYTHTARLEEDLVHLKLRVPVSPVTYDPYYLLPVLEHC